MEITEEREGREGGKARPRAPEQPTIKVESGLDMTVITAGEEGRGLELLTLRCPATQRNGIVFFPLI